MPDVECHSATATNPPRSQPFPPSQTETKAGKVALYEQVFVDQAATGRWVPVQRECHTYVDRFVATELINHERGLHTMSQMLCKSGTKNQVIEYVASGAALDRVPPMNRCAISALYGDVVPQHVPK